MTENYYDSLIECTLMIGVNEFTGLKPAKVKSVQKNHLEMANFQHNILAVLSSTVAVFPFSKDPHIYPPKEFGPSFSKNVEEVNKPDYFRSTSIENLGAIQELVKQYNSPTNLEKSFDLELGSTFVRRTSKNQSFRRKSCKAISIDTYKGSFGSISMETIKSFPGTYFNNNLKVFSNYIDPKIEYFPMTDNLGNRSYAFRLEFYRIFKMINNIIDDENADNNNTITLESVFETDLDCVDYVFIPSYIVFFSKYPYFDLFKEILSNLFISIKNRSTKIIDCQLMEYSAILSRIPIMKVDDIQIDFSIDKISYSIKPVNSIFEQIIDWNISLLFQLLSLDDIVFLILAMFQEQKIVFLSKYTNLITLICESLLVIFQPFSWKHFYLTVVPSHLYELVEAIFPFIIGLPHEHKSRIIESYNDIIAVDLDEGTIHKPTGCHVKRISDDLIKVLKQSLNNRDWLMFRDNLSDVKLNENSKNIFHQKNRKFAEKVMLDFMIMMVELFKEILENIPTEIPRQNQTYIINLDNYFSTSHSKNIDFFKAIYQSDNFNRFLDNKLRLSKPDSWSRICDKIYPAFFSQSSLVKTRTMSIKNTNEPIILQDPSSCQQFHLPTNRNERESYFEKIISKIDQFNDKTNSMKKLKMQIYLQMGNPIKALETIYTILEIDKCIEYDKIRKIINDLNGNLKTKLNKMEFSQRLYEIIKLDETDRSDSKNYQPKIQQFYPPNIPIPKNQFYEICRNANITDFESIANDFFRTLTIEQKSSRKQSKLVLPELFQCFYNNWIKISTDFIESDIDVKELPDEILIIHTTNSIKVDDFGQGKILLTNLRLLFISDNNKSLTTLVNFTEESLIKMRIEKKLKGFGKITEVLEIFTENYLKSLKNEKKSKKIVIWFPQDIEVWHNLLSEIGYGNLISYEEKDKNIQDRLTDQCLIYENLATCANENSFFKRNLYNMSKIMLSCTMSHIEESKNNREINSIHRKYIISKLMPYPKQSITIDCVLIIPKPILKNFDLWCALNLDGKCFLKRFEVINESIQSLSNEEIEIPDRMKIMMHLMGSNKIIYGCSDGTISLFNTVNFGIENFDVNIIQGYHPTCGLIHYESIHSHFAYIGISNGELIQCQPNSKKLKKIMQIPENLLINFIELYNSTTLIIGASHDIFIVSIHGEIISKIKISNINTIANRISSLTVISGNHRMIVGLHRLSGIIEYDITDKKNPVCLRKTNIYTNKEFDIDETTSHSESSSKSIGICSILNIQENKYQSLFWVMVKDGTVEIRNSQTLGILTSFTAHIGVIVYSMVCDLQNKKVIITVGRDDGKINLWNIKPT